MGEGFGEPHALRGKTVEVRRASVDAPVAAEVGAHVLSDDEDDVRTCWALRR
jgi:hypothetical protein